MQSCSSIKRAGGCIKMTGNNIFSFFLLLLNITEKQSNDNAIQHIINNIFNNDHMNTCENRQSIITVYTRFLIQFLGVNKLYYHLWISFSILHKRMILRFTHKTLSTFHSRVWFQYQVILFGHRNPHHKQATIVRPFYLITKDHILPIRV